MVVDQAATLSVVRRPGVAHGLAAVARRGLEVLSYIISLPRISLRAMVIWQSNLDLTTPRPGNSTA